MYFNKLGTTEYNGVTIPDIFKRIVIANDEIVKSDLFEQYEIIEGETPESLSFNYYGRVDYYWTILIINNIKSRFFDWPMNSQELAQYIDSKYGNKSALFFANSNNNMNLCDTKYIHKGSAEYEVLGCDRDLCKLEIQKVTETQIYAQDDLILLDKTRKYLTSNVVTRVVYENEFAVHHIEAQDKDNDVIIPSKQQLLTSYLNSAEMGGTFIVSNADYESTENEKRRKILLIKPSYINQFVSNFKALAQAE